MTVRWKVHCVSPPERVFSMLATDAGRATFWAESAREHDGVVHFVFPNGAECSGKVLELRDPQVFSVEYFGSVARFDLTSDGNGGTDLTLTDDGVSIDHYAEVNAGWVSVLLSLKAAVDYGVDLRNHDPERSWSQGFADN